MPTPIDTLRNIGIVAHIDAGKTTTTERILYYTGASHKMGDVDDGTTITDFDPEEARRGITIYSAAVSCRWQDCTINLIDTPGHVDFTAEVERSLRVLDGAVVIFSAVEGVEAQSETVWRQADRYRVPRLCFINKLDRIGADFERTLKQIEDRLHGKPAVLFLPIGLGNGFEAIIDIIERKARYFDKTSQGRNIDVRDIPDDLKDSVEQWRTRLLETLAENNEPLMEAYLAEEEISAETIHAALRKATIERHVQPIFCGTSLHYIGVQPLLDGVVRYLPSPLDRPPINGVHPNPKKGQDGHEIRKPSNQEPFSGLLFKIVADKHADLCFVRVYSGVLKSGSRQMNPRTGKKEFVSQLWHVQADQRERIETDQVEAGDIVGVIGPKEVVTGDTLCDAGHPILLETIAFPETVISMAVEPETNADRKKLEDALGRLARQDPTFNAKVSGETGQTIISGMGELHLEVLRERLQRDYNLNVRVHKPRVSYRETVRNKVRATGEFNRTVQGETQFASVTIEFEPFQGEESIAVRSQLKPDDLPADMLKVLMQAVLETGQGGGKVGYPLMHVRFTIVDVDYREAQSTEEALRQAAQRAVQNAVNDADIALLEPVMKLEVVTPPEFVGNIQADLNIRHARIFGSEQRGHLTVLDAEAPLANMFGYSTNVRSLSQGRASYSMEPLKYDLAPDSVLREMLS